MFDDDLFDHLTPRDTHEILLDGVHIPRDNDKAVVLIVKFAGRGSPYWNTILKFKPLADADAATERAVTAFVRHAVTGWKNVTKDGQAVAFSSSLCTEVLHKLVRAKRADKVDGAIAQAMNADNFRAPLVEATDLGKG